MQATDIFPLLGQIDAALAPLYRDNVRAKQVELGLEPGQPHYFWLAVTQDFDPEPISVATFSTLTQYVNPIVFENGLREMAERGWLAATDTGEYKLTAAGRLLLDSMYDVLTAELRALEPLLALPAADLLQIKALLSQLVEAALAAPEPDDKLRLRYNRHSDPGEAGPVLLNILQHTADLSSFRDDAHIAAFTPQRISGHAWEALTLIWRDEAHTAAELVERRPQRGYDAAAYAADLADLTARGWLQAEGEHYRITDAGAALRQRGEDETDRLYYAPWATLSAADLDTLGALITKLIEAAKVLQAAVEASA